MVYQFLFVVGVVCGDGCVDYVYVGVQFYVWEFVWLFGIGWYLCVGGLYVECEDGECGGKYGGMCKVVE